MAEDLAAYALLRAVTRSVEPVVVELEDLARDCVADLAPLLDSSRVTVLPSRITALADPPALRRVLTNLLTNALKYSEAGPVLVAFGPAGRGWVQVQVADRGRGIDAADLPTIFDEFERGRMAEDDGGSGLGLASVRKLVADQGGRVRIESAVGHGTVVTVELPSVAEPAQPRSG